MIKSLSFIRKKLIPYAVAYFSVYIILGFIYKELDWILVSAIGTLCSYQILSQMMTSQSNILKKQKKSMSFISMIFRMVLYAVPIGFVLSKQNYLNFGIILISLFVFQGMYICFEFKRSLKRVRRKKY